VLKDGAREVIDSHASKETRLKMAFRLPLASQQFVILNSGSPPAWVHESSVLDVPQSVSPLDLDFKKPMDDGRQTATTSRQTAGKATKADRSKTHQKTKKRVGRYEKRKSDGVPDTASCSC
jgi:hypothetical protein